MFILSYLLIGLLVAYLLVPAIRELTDDEVGQKFWIVLAILFWWLCVSIIFLSWLAGVILKCREN